MSLYKCISRLSLFILLMFSLTGCDDFASFNEAPRKVVVEVATPESAQKVRPILMLRFTSYRPMIFSTVDVDVKGRQLAFTFNRGAPGRDVVEALITRTGMLKARTETGVTSFEKNDIRVAMVSRAEDRNALNIGLSDKAGEVMERLTRENVGKVLTMELDDQLLSQGVIRDPFGERFQLVLPLDREELRLIAVMLESGPLPETVKILSNEL